MLVTVCYREADEGQLEAFVEEVQKEGRMTENTKLFLEKLEEKNKDDGKDDTAENHAQEVRNTYLND